MVLAHIIATGGIALTDDLLGQFLGQDLLRRLSRRLGEGAFNGALTARMGVAAIEVIRPLPFLAAKPPTRARHPRRGPQADVRAGQDVSLSSRCCHRDPRAASAGALDRRVPRQAPV